MDNQTIMTVQEVAKYLRLGKRTMYQMIKNREVPCIKVGGSWRFQRHKIEQWLEQHYDEQNDSDRTDTLRILVVDDEPIQRDAFVDGLGSLLDNAQIHSADNGISALVAVGRFHPHVIVLDIHIPQVDGIEVCQRLKDEPETRDIMIIAVTGFYEGYRERALNAGADMYMEKPFRIGQLAEKIKDRMITVPA